MINSAKMMFLAGAVVLCAGNASAQPLGSLSELVAAPAPAALQGDAPEPAPAAPGTGDRTARNMVYLELLGNGLLYSVNYERLVTNDLSLRAGVGFFSLVSFEGDDDYEKVKVLTAPLMVNYLGIGNENHSLVLGAGALLIYAWETSSVGFGGDVVDEGALVGATATIGYRYVPHDGGVTFNAGFTPVLLGDVIAPWGGIGVGAVF